MALGLGEVVELVPQAADPKNLFGVLRLQPAVSAALAAPPASVAAAML